VNRRKSTGGGGRKTLLALLVVLALIGLVIYLLEQTRHTSLAPKATKSDGPAVYQKVPPRPELPVQGKVSTAARPVAAPPVAARPRAAGHGNVAIIIDDMGSSMKELQELLAIHEPVTFSVIPSLAHARDVAEAAHRAHAEVMVHMPMEPEGYPQQRMEKIGLLVTMGDAEINERVNGYFRSVPHAVGANNHMGSRFTQSAEKMEVVLKVLQEKGMYFVDSKTSPKSAGYGMARALGLKCANRQVFLDNVQDEALIGKQLEQAVALARKNGSAIAICHPHPATIRALKALVPQLAKEGITFVPASALVS
jgi:polysaccharide deacetylase 2 family uncharacterized protein YibQ